MVKVTTVWEYKNKIVFPEVDYDKVDKIRGLDITINTSANNSDEAQALLVAFNFPFKRQG